MRKIPVAIACVLLATAPAHADLAKPLPRSLAMLTPDHFATRVVVADDPLISELILSTQAGYKRGQPMIGAFADDVHLRARVDRDTGQVRWEVLHNLINFGRKAKVTQVTYLDGKTPRTVVPTSVDQWQDVCSPGDSATPCHSYMRVVFEVPRHVVEDIARSYRKGSRQPWRILFKAESGDNLIGGLAPAEAAGLLLAINAR